MAAALDPIQQTLNVMDARLDRIEDRLDSLEAKCNRMQRVVALVECLLFSFLCSLNDQCSSGTKANQSLTPVAWRWSRF